MAKKGALCSSLFISRRTFLGSTDISLFCVKGLKNFGEPLGSCKSLCETVVFGKKLYNAEKNAVVIL